MGKVSLYINIKDHIDSRALWEELKGITGINCTDIIVETGVYGEVNAKEVDKIIEICEKYGRCDIGKYVEEEA